MELKELKKVAVREHQLPFQIVYIDSKGNQKDYVVRINKTKTGIFLNKKEY